MLIGIVTAFLAVINPFYALDAYLTDKLYTKLTGTDSDIIIIGVDEETLAEYGNFNLWSREKSAELLEYLHEDETNCPAVVGLDFMFIDSYDEEATSDRKTKLESVLKSDAFFKVYDEYKSQHIVRFRASFWDDIDLDAYSGSKAENFFSLFDEKISFK